VHDGQYGFAQLEKRKFTDREITRFARDRIEVVRDEALEKLLPEKWPGAVEVYTVNGKRFFRQVEYHVGQVQNPISNERLYEKFLNMAAGLGARTAEQIIGIVSTLERLDDISRLTRLLRSRP
jgi:2-methylcitrate dehydratase PrpD